MGLLLSRTHLHGENKVRSLRFTLAGKEILEMTLSLILPAILP